MKEKILAMRQSGLSYEAIAKAVPCACSTVWYYLTPGASAQRKRLSKEYQKSFGNKLKADHGGKCCVCGYNKCLYALDFHHTNSSGKDGCVAYFVANGQFRKARQEVKKCVLICANCHRELHDPNKVVAPSGISPASAD